MFDDIEVMLRLLRGSPYPEPLGTWTGLCTTWQWNLDTVSVFWHNMCENWRNTDVVLRFDLCRPWNINLSFINILAHMQTKTSINSWKIVKNIVQMWKCSKHIFFCSFYGILSLHAKKLCVARWLVANKKTKRKTILKILNTSKKKI